MLAVTATWQVRLYPEGDPGGGLPFGQGLPAPPSCAPRPPDSRGVLASMFRRSYLRNIIVPVVYLLAEVGALGW